MLEGEISVTEIIKVGHAPGSVVEGRKWNLKQSDQGKPYWEVGIWREKKWKIWEEAPQGWATFVERGRSKCW